VATELRQVKLLMTPGELETADALAKLHGTTDRTSYVRALIAEDAERWISELRRLQWQAAREDDAVAPAEAPPKPLATGADPPQGA
jgi:hypothetical protein